MREQFTFYRSFWEAAKEIEKPRDRLSFLEAVIAFALDEEEREVTRAARSSYILCKPTLLSSARKAKAGKDGASKREANRKQAASKSQANEKQTASEKEKEKEKENEIEIENECYKAPARFVPPTVDEVRAYCAERQNGVDAERFVAWYQANGWKVGKNPMKDWRAAVRTWERDDPHPAAKNTPPKNDHAAMPTKADVESTRRFLERLKAED